MVRRGASGVEGELDVSPSSPVGRSVKNCLTFDQGQIGLVLI